jgi:hypothetical protein
MILMKDALCSTETSVLSRATRRNIPENVILYVITFFKMDGVCLNLQCCISFNIPKQTIDDDDDGGGGGECGVAGIMRIGWKTEILS